MAGRSTQAGEGQARRYLSPQEFSTLSGLSLSTVHRYLRRGRLPYQQPAGRRGRILIPATVLEQIADDPSSAGSAQAPVAPLAGTANSPRTSARPSGPRPKWIRLADPTPEKEDETHHARQA